jgi:cytochrome c-type biogenesis protein CcmH
MMLLRAALLLALLFPATAAPAAVGDPRERLADPALEERAQAIGRELRCLVCQNQSIEDSNADLARDLRLIVRERLAAGATDAQVVRFVHDRYGDFVLLRPPVTAATALLWAAPALVLAGAVAAILIARRRRRSAGEAEAATLTEAERARLAAMESGGGDPRPS